MENIETVRNAIMKIGGQGMYKAKETTYGYIEVRALDGIITSVLIEVVEQNTDLVLRHIRKEGEIILALFVPKEHSMKI